MWTRRSNGLKSLRRRVADGSLIAVRPDMFARREYWDALGYRERIMHTLRAVTARHPNWILCCISAATVWGLSETYALHEFVHVAIDGHSRTRDRGYYRFHYVANVRGELRDGVLVTPLLQTVFDCIRMLPFPEALAICDAALRDLHLDSGDLARFIDEKAGHKGVRRARIVAHHADPRSENGGESIARA
ncbi:CTP synthase [Bifidobacterium sp. DSM 109958]|uniref:CTP synthase n=1 Tax=Bifidobacterium moraviense TaxID=2675323 RepID=A0A7Y0F180_9BIFI|nr:CTP synthase [Bifidobacterium sp. DSM 109958]